MNDWMTDDKMTEREYEYYIQNNTILLISIKTKEIWEILTIYIKHEQQNEN